ncbi:DNA-processing protein DprA [Bacillus sp. NPDC077027]|uniref:DNA-processing protein DprA n=1 Tax=Bacillus sp. NPDC077027 TaxID=3390548 RepID=UPI003D032A03
MNASDRVIFHRLKGLISPSLLTKWWKADPDLYINEEKHHFKQDRTLQTIDFTRLKQAEESEFPIFQNIVQSYLKKNIHMIPITSPLYPENLKNIYDPPPVLFLKGKLSYLNEEKSLGVVGTRIPSIYGKECVKQIVGDLVKDNWIIVSGLAKGIDGLAHTKCIKKKGKTIGVVAGGFDHLYPKENVQMAEYMGVHHLLLSEHPPYVRPEKWHFPMRNRLISGITKGTVVIQCKEKSGSLITAYQALEQGKEVFAVAGPIFDPNSAGPARLIQQGAKLVHSTSDILEEFTVANVQYMELL